MEKTLIIYLLLFSPLLLIGQSETTPTIDSRLYDVFDADFLETLQEKAPSQIQYYNFFLDNVYHIEALPNGKTTQYEAVTIDDLDNINILKIINEQQLKRDYNHMTFYKIANTNKILVLLSEKAFAKKFNLHTGRIEK